MDENTTVFCVWIIGVFVVWIGYWIVLLCSSDLRDWHREDDQTWLFPMFAIPFWPIILIMFVVLLPITIPMAIASGIVERKK